APLEMRQPSVGGLPRGVEGGERVAHVAPDGDVQRESVAEEPRIVPDSDDGARLAEAEVRLVAARVLPVADAAHDVVVLLRDRLDTADVVRVMHGKAAVVEDAGGYRQREALGQREDLFLGAGRADVRSADEERLLRVEQRVPDRADHT